MKKIIARDFDDTLVNSAQGYIDYLKTHWKNLKFEDITDYWVPSKLMWYPEDDIFTFYHEVAKSHIHATIQPNLWALEAIKNLSLKWYQHFIVTSRSSDYMHSYTLELATSLFEKYIQDIIYVNKDDTQFNKKWVYVKDLWACAFIDDSYSQCQDVQKHWIQSYVINKPWNKNEDNKKDWVIRLAQISDIEKYL